LEGEREKKKKKGSYMAGRADRRPGEREKKRKRKKKKKGSYMAGRADRRPGERAKKKKKEGKKKRKKRGSWMKKKSLESPSLFSSAFLLLFFDLLFSFSFSSSHLREYGAG
jgi:hypothetical protein